jgi:hypothetical protein
VISKRKARLFGVALATLSAFSMVATPAYPGPSSGKRVSFKTSAAVLEHVKANNPDLYQRLIQYRTGQRVQVSAKEHAYLKKLNRVAAIAAKQQAAQQKAQAYEFSSQSRVSQEARAAYAQAATVVVTPKPWWEIWKSILTPAVPAAGAVALAFPVFAPFVVIINIILIIIEAFVKIAEAATKK